MFTRFSIDLITGRLAVSGAVASWLAVLCSCSVHDKWEKDGDSRIDTVVDTIWDSSDPGHDPADVPLPDLPPDADPDAPCAGVLYEQDFDSTDGGFLVEGSNASWAWGVPTTGPAGCFGDTGSCWKTNLHGIYSLCEDSTLTSPDIYLGMCSGSGATLRVAYMHWYDFERTGGNCFDGVGVEFSPNGGETWVQVAPTGGWVDLAGRVGIWECPEGYDPRAAGLHGFTCDGMEMTWQEVLFLLPTEHVGPRTRIRFTMGSDGIDSFQGYTIDSLTITAVP